MPADTCANGDTNLGCLMRHSGPPRRTRNPERAPVYELNPDPPAPKRVARAARPRKPKPELPAAPEPELDEPVYIQGLLRPCATCGIRRRGWQMTRKYRLNFCSFECIDAHESGRKE